MHLSERPDATEVSGVTKTFGSTQGADLGFTHGADVTRNPDITDKSITGSHDNNSVVYVTIGAAVTITTLDADGLHTTSVPTLSPEMVIKSFRRNVRLLFSIRVTQYIIVVDMNLPNISLCM